MNILWFNNFRTNGIFNKAKKGKCLVSSYPTDPNILGPTQTFFKTFGILKSIFRLFLWIFILFQYKKVFIKKKGCLPTDPKNFGHVSGNKTYFSFGLKLLSIKSEWSIVYIEGFQVIIFIKLLYFFL